MATDSVQPISNPLFEKILELEGENEQLREENVRLRAQLAFFEEAARRARRLGERDLDDDRDPIGSQS